LCPPLKIAAQRPITETVHPLDGTEPIPHELPRVTAVVAAYNYAEYIADALDSALNQDYPPELLDIVVVDDGSTDATPEILERYHAAHPDRITVIHQPNAGNKAAANTAVQAASGELLAMLDADDVWPADKTRRQAERMAQDPSLGLVYCDTTVIDADGEVLHDSYWAWLGFPPHGGPSALAEIVGYWGNVSINSTIMFRATLAQRIFPIPTRVTFQDWWITAWAAALMGIDWIGEVCVRYRRHGGNGLLGATGLGRMSGRCRTAEVRRQLLAHGIGDHLTEEELLVAWQAWEHTLREAMGEFQTAYLPIVGPDDDERERSRRHAALADEAIAVGDTRQAMRERIRALACNPMDIVSRQWVLDLEWVLKVREKAVTPAEAAGPLRSFVTLTYADELVDEPDLLADYVSVVSEDDDATLAISADGFGEELAVKAVATAADNAGVDVGRLPDVLLVTEGGAARVAELERRANAVLSRRDEDLAAPLWQPAGFARLKVLGRG
jgi:hypothetical protein